MTRANDSLESALKRIALAPGGQIVSHGDGNGFISSLTTQPITASRRTHRALPSTGLTLIDQALK